MCYCLSHPKCCYDNYCTPATIRHGSRKCDHLKFFFICWPIVDSKALVSCSKLILSYWTNMDDWQPPCEFMLVSMGVSYSQGNTVFHRFQKQAAGLKVSSLTLGRQRPEVVMGTPSSATIMILDDDHAGIFHFEGEIHYTSLSYPPLIKVDCTARSRFSAQVLITRRWNLSVRCT